jgi:tryptophan-rich sensory protein
VIWLIAGAICLAAVVAEGLLSGDASAFLKSIKQPRWALPLPAWIGIGLLYYLACFFALTRVLAFGLHEPVAAGAFAALVLVMAANAGFNWVFFKRRDFRAAFYYYFPYGALVAVLIWLLARIEAAPAIAFAAYACYLPYALFWSYRVWKLN